MSTFNIEVDGQQLEAEAGEMLIQVTDRNDIYIPRFCYHEKLSIAANCRMCLVEVERAPKPLPACATPVMDGMKVFTKSEYARDAQKGTMEFLLINHPLDCPVCDQGGECPLQDQAMGFGGDDSRYVEKKRSVPSHDIGPLVATEMTRCIHCTRCVRFGEEIAGVMEMGAPGRGEDVKISTFLNQSIDSEVSGNIIDLCPVGALTSKPYRFSARSWELRNHASISPYDCLGSNINIQTLRDEVERVLPIENPEINDCWLSDRDRFSYEAVNSDNRLTHPMIKDANGWKETDWETALNHASAGLKTIIESGSGSDIAGLAAATSTLEEFHLLQKLIRGVGSENIDHRLQQCDFRTDTDSLPTPLSEVAIRDYDNLSSILLVGSNIRKEQPLLGLRIRNGVLKSGTTVSAVNPVDYEFNFDLVEKEIAGGLDLVKTLCNLASTIANAQSISLPDEIAELANSTVMTASAENLIAAGENGLIVLGALAHQHADAALLRSISTWICKNTGNKLAVLAPANSVAAYEAKCLPGANGKNAANMMQQGSRGFILLGCEPELDCLDGKAALDAMSQSEFVVQLSAFKSESVMQYADVLLPMAAFTESAGTYINCEGKRQQSKVAASPKGEARPAWKILRVLGNFMQCQGFDQVTLDDVSAEIPMTLESSDNLTEADLIFHAAQSNETSSSSNQLLRIADMPMYRGDVTLRHASALQRTADNPAPAASIHPQLAEKLQLSPGDEVQVKNGTGSAQLKINLSSRINQDCVYIPAGFMETANLGGHVLVTLEKA